jgi:hypothetical protein
LSSQISIVKHKGKGKGGDYETERISWDFFLFLARKKATRQTEALLLIKKN